MLSFAYIYLLFHVSFTFECKRMGEIMVYFTPERGKEESFRITLVFWTSSLVFGAKYSPTLFKIENEFPLHENFSEIGLEEIGLCQGEDMMMLLKHNN